MDRSSETYLGAFCELLVPGSDSSSSSIINFSLNIRKQKWLNVSIVI